jgi:curved DNA-binding protein CbpA
MEHWEDYYGLLQVHPQAGQEVIQSAYKRLCRMVHPDVNPDPSAAKTMQRINAAYETLSEPLRRKRYHAEWERKSAGGAASPRVEVRERVVYINREEQRDGGTAAAAAAVRDYFEFLSRRDYRGAYALVSEEDKRCFTYGAYIDWQESVGALYEVGETRLRLFKSYTAFKTNAGNKLCAEEYTVRLSEKEKTTGRVSEYTLTKYAVLEGGVWRVYLGYRDLTPLKLQFKAMAQNPKEAQLLTLWEKHKAQNSLDMGMPNRLGLEESLEREIYRYKRYARPFALGLFSASLPAHVTDKGIRERVMKYAGYVISEAVRCIDTAAWLDSGVFAVVLAETDKSRAALAIRRITRTVRHDISACFDFDISITAGAANYSGQDTQSLIDACTRMVNAPSKASADEGRVEAL